MFMLQRMSQMAAVATAGDPPFPVNAVDFDGTNDYLSRGSGLSTISDGSGGLLSFWVRLDALGTTKGVLVSDTFSVFAVVNNANKILISVTDSAGSSSLEFAVTAALSASVWYHVLVAWSTAFSAGNKIIQVYINDVSAAGTKTDASASFSVDYTTADWYVGATSGAANKMNGCLSELYFEDSYLDISNSLNRRKFIGSGGKPVDLGSDGSLPTGSQPIIYLNDPAASFGTNKGVGGNFTITGTLDTASSSPSD